MSEAGSTSLAEVEALSAKLDPTNASAVGTTV